MQIARIAALLLAVSAITCEYPYIFGTSINSKGIANGQGGHGIAGAQTTAYGLDDVSQSVAYSNGTQESNARAGGQAIFTTQLTGANTGADGINTGEGNSLTDSVSKSFNPSDAYYSANYAQYMQFLGDLFQKYPEQRTEILKVVAKYAELEKSAKTANGEKATKNVDASLKVTALKQSAGPVAPATNGGDLTIANFNDANAANIGQTTFDYQRARGSGKQTAASSNSGNFRWNNATVHQGQSTGNAKQGWATSASNNHGLGRVNYVNSEQNAGANGDDAQTNSASNYYLTREGVWNNGDAWGRAAGKDSLAFSNLNGNAYGYGAVDGDTNAYTDGDLAVSKSQLKGAPYMAAN